MYERSFIVYVDVNTPNHTHEVALAAASELFDVQADFDESTDEDHIEILEVPDNNSAPNANNDDQQHHSASNTNNYSAPTPNNDDPTIRQQQQQPPLREPRWVTIKSSSIDNAEEAKIYLMACFSPQTIGTESAVKGLLEILQDAHGLWWRSLEHEFKVRIKLANQDEEQIPALVSDQIIELTLFIQGTEDSVAYASSYISELNENLKNPPSFDPSSIDEASVRKEFQNEIEPISEIDWSKYSKYNPYVLRSLLKWLYFIKGIDPSNDDYVLKLTPKKDVAVAITNGTDSLSTLDDEVWSTNNSTDQSADFKMTDAESLGGYVDVRSPLRLDSGSSSDVSMPSTSTRGSSSNKDPKKTASADIPPLNERNFIESIKTLATAVVSATSDKSVDVTLAAQALAKLPQQAQPSYRIDTTDVEYNLLRPIILDGSNLAMQHGRHKVFSCRGILLACKYFIERGHRVWAFVPQFRQSQNPDNPHRRMQDQYLLDWMEMHDLLVYTPSRQIHTDEGRRRITCYDDNMIVQYAHKFGGIVVSKDNYRDVVSDHPEWTETVHTRLLMYSWVNDVLMIPVDPLGKGGPGLEEFLRFKRNEVVPHQPSKLMNKQSCLQLLHEIEEVLSAPPPPPETYQPACFRRWEPYNRPFNQRRGYTVNEYEQPSYSKY